MSTPTSIDIEAVVADQERPAVAAGMEQLVECLYAGCGDTWTVRVALRPNPAAIDVRRAQIIIASFVPEVASDEPLRQLEKRWRATLSLLVQAGIPRIFVGTVFRHVANQIGQKDGTIERIRRLNMLAIELSHDLGIGVVDIDRAFAHWGARALQTDYRLTGRIAAEVAGHTMVASMLSIGLDGIVPAEIQERARQFHGDLWTMDRRIQRRIHAGAQGA